MTKTEQIKTLTEARNALLAATKTIKNAHGNETEVDEQRVDIFTNEAIGLIAQIREARGLDE